MEYRRNKSKFPSGNNISTYPYYNRYNNTNKNTNKNINKNTNKYNNNRNYKNNNNNNNNTNVNKRKPKPIIRKENPWLYTSVELNSSTPSIKDGYTLKEELKQRWKACAFIMSIGMTMKIPQITIATACTYLHRFYCRKSLKYYPSYEIAASSLYLASKTTDTQRRLKDLIIVCISKAQKNTKFAIKGKKFPVKLLIIKGDKFMIKKEPEEEIIFNDDYNHLSKKKIENGKKKSEKENKKK